MTKCSIIFFALIALVGCKEFGVEEQHSNLKDLKVNLDSLPTIFNEVANSKSEGAFATFAIGHEEDSINIQFSIFNFHLKTVRYD